jgi:CheY-like chemotaxis protein
MEAHLSAVMVLSEIAAGLSGRKFALIGFDEPESSRLALALERVKSTSLTLDPRQTDPHSTDVSAADAILLSLSPTLEDSRWIALEALAKNSKPILLVGTPEDLLRRTGLQEFAHAVLIAPHSDEEMLLRAHRLISRLAAKPRSLAVDGQHILRVLIADDDPAITSLLEATLSDYHTECLIARNGMEALAMARQCLPDLILLDVDMPALSGFEVLACLRQHSGTRALRIIVLTASYETADIRRGSDLGADDYIAKPFSANDLTVRVRKLLRSSGRGSEPAESPKLIPKTVTPVHSAVWTASPSNRSRL